MLALEAVGHSYRSYQSEFIFKDISFTLAPGEALKIIGGNGCGKTTLLKIVCYSLPPESGRVRWDDEDVAECRDEYWEELLYVGHKNALAEELSPLENLQSKACLRARAPAQPCAEALSAAGLKSWSAPCRLLSAGQRRRVALAALAAFSARLWVLDEPLAALDKAGREMMSAWMDAHLRRGGMALVSMHHDAEWLPSAKILRM